MSDTEKLFQHYLNRLKEIASHRDVERAHGDADAILILVIRELWSTIPQTGNFDIEDVIKAYKDVPKWYS